MNIKGALLLGSCFTALIISSPVLAQDASADPVADAFSALSLTGGASVLALPGMRTGVFTDGAGTFSPFSNPLGLGAQIGLSFGGTLGKTGDWDIISGLSLSAVIASANSTTVDTFTGQGVVVIQSYSPGTATFNLDTTRDGANASADSVIDITDTGANVANATTGVTSVPAGTSAAFGVTPTAGDGFAFSGVTSSGGSTAAAYGATADTSGFTFIGVGDLEGLTVTTNASETVLMASGDINIGVGGAADESTYLQAYIGPSARHIGRNIDTSIAVDIPEVNATIFPEIGMNRSEELNGDYIGGLLGIGVSRFDETSGIVYSLTGEGGVYAYGFSYTGNETFNIAGNTVTSATTVSEQSNGVAWLARAQAAMTLPMSGNSTLTFAGSAEYLSRAPSITRAQGPAVVINQAGNDYDADYTSVAGANANSHISFGEMWSFGATASWTTSF